MYHQSNYKLIGIDLSRQTIPKQINLGEKLEEGNGATKFFVAEKQQQKNIEYIFENDQKMKQCQ